jgi:uncharacterized protein (TIGR04141 family)
MATAAHGKKLRLTVFLIKEGYRNIEDFLQVGQLRRVLVTSAGAEGTLFFKSGFKSRPPWARIFHGVPGFDSNYIVNQHSRGLYVLQVDDRWFCFTFGYTRHLLVESAVERNFGLIVALNLGDPDAIKAIDKTNISHVGLQSREQAGRDIGFDGFEFDTDIDLLKSITAKAPVVDGEDQETYSGRDSFSVYTRVDLSSFADIAKKLRKARQSSAYQKRYPWVDKISEERDSTVVAKLDSALVRDINNGAVGHIWLAVPEIISWEELEGFAYRIGSSSPRKAGRVLHADIDLDGWLAETKRQGRLTLKHLTAGKIYQCFKDDRDPATWGVYRCLNAEIDLDGSKYILNDGDWYKVDRDYVKDVDRFYRLVAHSSLLLPPYGAKTEPAYLKSVSKSHPQFALMDRKNVMIGGGRSRIEFCDLFSKDNEIIHVKQYGGSSVLSHLFSQAVVSGECFLHESPFRREVNKLLPSAFRLSDPATNPVPGIYTICMAIMSKVPGPLEIPFFSKVSMKHAVTSLQRMGFNVNKLKIER